MFFKFINWIDLSDFIISSLYSVWLTQMSIQTHDKKKWQYNNNDKFKFIMWNDLTDIIILN